MIQLNDVSFGYTESLLFEEVNLTIKQGELVLLRGKSGCGKTSFLHLLNRFQEPVRGEIRLQDRPYADYRYQELRRSVIYLHQVPVMRAGVSVRENLLLPFSFHLNRQHRVPGDQVIDRLFSEFHLGCDILDRDAASLSPGEQQRVAILRATLLDPDFLLLDEPIASLDRESAVVIQEWIARRVRDQAGIVVVSHHPLEALADCMTRCFDFRGGRLAENSG